MKNKIIKAPNDILRKKVDDTTLIDDKYRVVAEYMLQTLQQYNAAGLAANQVGYDTVSYTHLTLPTILRV